MKLYLLKPVEWLPEDGQLNPREPRYDKCFGMVIRASDEPSARKLADDNAAYENWYSHEKTPRLDDKLSTCIELSADWEEEVIIKEEHRA